MFRRKPKKLVPAFYDPLDIQYGGVFQINDKGHTHVGIKAKNDEAMKYYVAKMKEAATKHGLVIYDDKREGCYCAQCRDEHLDPRAQVFFHRHGARDTRSPDYRRYHTAMAAWVMERLDEGEEIEIATGEDMLTGTIANGCVWLYEQWYHYKDASWWDHATETNKRVRTVTFAECPYPPCIYGYGLVFGDEYYDFSKYARWQWESDVAKAHEMLTTHMLLEHEAEIEIGSGMVIV